MESTVAWDRPCEFQLANWTVGEPVADLRVPVEYASIDIPGDCGIQAYEYDVQQLLVEYYSAASRRYSTSEKAKISNDSHARSVVNLVLGGFEADMNLMEHKMHRYPTCLGAVDKSYTVPRIVAIGPYHHGLEHLKQAEKVKHVAACHCIGEVQLLEDMYGKFVPVADDARRFYDEDVMAGISYDDFRHMMFFDACFLVQYIVMQSTSDRERIDGSLQRFFRPNRNDIFHDIMLLENQLPWTVVETVLSFLGDGGPDGPSIPKKFIRRVRYYMQPVDHREPPEEEESFNWDDKYRPPHLLGLFRYYIVGRRRDTDEGDSKQKPKNVSLSVSAMDLAEIGITLKANKTMQIIDMCLHQKGAVFTELSLAPLNLDRDCASYLVNMAALELCTMESFGAATDEDSAVCSYVMLLANLVYREEEVQELRERGVLQRGGGLSNEEALRFFTSFQGLRFGPNYYRIMVQIKTYRDNSRMKTKLHGFVHNHKKTIAAVVTGFGAVGGIIGTLLSIRKSI